VHARAETLIARLRTHGIYPLAVVSWLAGLPVVPFRARAALLNLAGCDVHPGARLSPGTMVLGPRLLVEEGVFANVGCLLDGRGQVTIGARAHLGPGVRLLTATHEVGARAQRAGENRAGAVRVGTGAWVGAGATILPGVTVGDGCVIAAGAVVTRDCEPDGFYAGVPATRRRSLEADGAGRS
jgi:maltose O-acetyltransferase